jgi:hypothetical protein
MGAGVIGLAALFLAALFLAALFLAAPLGAAELPPEILKDKYQIVLERHLAAKSYDRAVHYLERLAELRDTQGVTLDESFDYTRAMVHYQLHEYETASRHATQYLSTVGRQGKHYQEALALLVDAEDAAANLADQSREAEARRAAATRAQQETERVQRDAASRQATLEEQARQSALERMAGELERQQGQAQQAEQAPQAPPEPARPDPVLLERQAALGREFAALIADFRFDSEAQAVDGNPGQRYIFRLTADIRQRAQAGPGPCQLSFSSDGGYSVDRTALTYAGTREKMSERVAQASVKITISNFDAANLRVNTTDPLHKAFNIYTFSSGQDQKITIHGAGGYMLRLYDVATAWGKACSL